jgi:hypothetical protein
MASVEGMLLAPAKTLRKADISDAWQVIGTIQSSMGTRWGRALIADQAKSSDGTIRKRLGGGR